MLIASPTAFAGDKLDVILLLVWAESPHFFNNHGNHLSRRKFAIQNTKRTSSEEAEYRGRTGPAGSGHRGRPAVEEPHVSDRRARGRTPVITDRLLEPGPESLSSKLEVMKTFAVSRLTNLRKLISHPESVDQARAALAEFFGRFTLDPTNQAGEAWYTVRGEVDFFGGEGWRERVVPGARFARRVYTLSAYRWRREPTTRHRKMPVSA